MMTFNKYGMRMFEEFEAGGGSEGNEENNEGNDNQQQTESKPSHTVDAKALAEEFGSVLSKQFKEREDSNQQRQQSRPPTAEERAAARKQFGMFDVDDAFVQKFSNLETQKQAIQEMVDRIYESQGNITAAMLAKQHQQWESQFEPVRQILTQREESERVSRFHSKYPQLADENLAPVISGVGQKLAAANAFNGLSEAQAFERLAQGVESVIKHHNPSFTLNKNNSGKSSNEIPVETSGSRGGGGQPGSTVKADSPNGLFGPVKSSKR